MAGLTSLPRKMNIKGQPHNLAYINKTESDILKSIGGAGKPRKGTKGVPSYDFGDYGVDGFGLDEGVDAGYDIGFSGTDQAASAAAAEAAAAEAAAAEAAAAPTPSTARGDFADVAGLPPGTPMGPMGTSSAYTSKDPSQTLAAYNIPPETAVPGADLLMDPVIQDVLYSTKPSQFSRESYTQSVRDAVKSMTPEEKYGTIVDPLAPWESPLFGQRVGGYLPMLEEYTLPTYMGGFRGGRETSAPYALTDPESDRYQDVFMAFAGTTGGAIREALDAAKRGQTVEGALENTGHTAFGLPAQAPATGLANYLDREAMKGWAQGLGIVMSMTSPFMPAAAMGIPQDVWEDVKGPLNSLRETLRDAIPFFEKEVEPKFDKAVDVVRDNYEKNVEQTGTDILDTIFDAIKGKGASQEAREFGSNYQLPTISAPASPEPTLEDIAPVQTDIGGVPASEFLDIEPMMLYDPVVDQMPEVPVTLDEAIAYSQVLERERDVDRQVNAQRDGMFNPETYPFPSRPLELPPTLPLDKAMVDQRREDDIAIAAMMQNKFGNYPVELAAPVTPVSSFPLPPVSSVVSPATVREADRAVEIQQLAPLPEEVDIEQATFREPSAIEKSTPVEFGREELVPIEPEDLANLIDAVATVESNKNQAAVGAKGERSSMQVMPGTVKFPGFNIEPARNKSLDEINRVGVDYLTTMAAKFGNIKDALVAYNAGPGFAQSWIARGRNFENLPKTTQDYLVRVADELN